MSTVDKRIADGIIAGKYEEDKWQRIVRYTSAWGDDCYGCTRLGEDQNRYLVPSHHVRNPSIYWNRNMSKDKIDTEVDFKEELINVLLALAIELKNSEDMRNSIPDHPAALLIILSIGIFKNRKKAQEESIIRNMTKATDAKMEAAVEADLNNPKVSHEVSQFVEDIINKVKGQT